MAELAEPRIAPAPDEVHYRQVADEADRLAVFLGSGVNADDHEGDWQEGCHFLPDDEQLAEYLAKLVGWDREPLDLAEVAQRVDTLRDTRMFPRLHSVLAVDSTPGPVHTFLANLPELLEMAGKGRHYPLIVTPKYDLALERALKGRKPPQPFDVVVYVGPGAEVRGSVGEKPCFVHVPWDTDYLEEKDVDVEKWKPGDGIPITVGNDYESFPIRWGAEGWELKRTLIVRVNGAVDDYAAGFPWEKNYVITEDQYIDYLSDGAAVPKQILAQLKESCYLFLGYKIADWRLRVFLKQIKRNVQVSARHWAIERNPDEFEARLWDNFRVKLYQSRLSDYVGRLEEFLVAKGVRDDDRAR